MGPVGVQEMMFIFLLALLLFGPKKLPELGRMLGKAMTEFRRAQNELKSTFEREMRNLEQENQSLKELTSNYQFDNYNYDYSSHEAPEPADPYGLMAAEPAEPTVTNTSTESASATEGAELKPVELPEGAVAHGTETAVAAERSTPPEGAAATNGSSTPDHSA